MKPTKEERNQLIDLLTKKYKISTRFLNILMDESGSYSQLLDVIGRDFSNREKIKLLIYQKESLFFAGSKPRTIELRAKLIEKLPLQVIDELFKKHCKTKGNSKSHKVNNLASKNWVSGKGWASTFVSVLGLPKIFSGVRTEGKPPVIEDVDPFIVPPKLTDFQVELKNNLLSILNNEGDKTRCIISLPTGGGKTRTAVEAFIEWLQQRFANGQYLIWIAQSQELCNQAIECIRQLWASKRYTETLRIYRYFGGTNLEKSDLIGGVVVASIGQLSSRINKDENIKEIVSKTGSIIIDEAHKSAAKSYIDFFDFCKEQSKSPDLFPICGLTATPGRSFGKTQLLAKLFEYKLFTPSLGIEFENNPLEFFRKEGYLARPDPKQVFTHIDIPNSLFEDSKKDSEKKLNKTAIKELAGNKKRNTIIIKELLSIPKGQLTLVYACTVAHAELIATILNYKGRLATSISASTPRHYRRKLLEQFKKGEIQYVVNYGVLTTGFDAPQTQNIVICRPTFSEILYEQIVGRGLRGPKFGGTEKCTIIDFSDNYERFGDQQAYHRFEHFWDKS